MYTNDMITYRTRHANQQTRTHLPGPHLRTKKGPQPNLVQWPETLRSPLPQLHTPMPARTIHRKFQIRDQTTLTLAPCYAGRPAGLQVPRELAHTHMLICPSIYDASTTEEILASDRDSRVTQQHQRTTSPESRKVEDPEEKKKKTGGKGM